MTGKHLFVLLLTFLITGCSIFVKKPGQVLKGSNVVCILFNSKRFKTEVVKNVSEFLAGKGFKVVTDTVKKAKYYNSDDYAAVVYMAELWAWHTPLHAKKFYRKNSEAENIIFVITSGDPDVVIKKPFDAVTSASRPDQVNRVSGEIMERLDSILGK